MSLKQKRVLFLINSFAVGGAERVFINDAIALRARGWDVHTAVLFARGALASELDAADIPVHELTWRSIFDIRGVLRLRRLVRDIAPSAVLSSLNEANAAARFARLLGARARLFSREANMADAKGLKYKVGDVVFGWLSSTIVAVSKAVGDSQCAYAPWLRSRVAVLYNGADVSLPPPVRHFEHAHKLLAVGSLTEKKDHEILIRALALLPEQVRLTVVGTGPLEGELEALVAQLGLGGRVSFLGHVPHASLREVYESHDLFVLPSKREGCPNVVSEAQSAGLPVVAFSIPGMDEFVSAESGVLVRERSVSALSGSIAALIADAVNMASLGAAGYAEVCQNRSNGAHVQKLLELLTKHYE